MSILGNVFKVAGTVVEGCGKIIVDCVNEIETSNAEYRKTEEYKKAKAEREELMKEIKTNLKKIETSVGDYVRNKNKNN